MWIILEVELTNAFFPEPADLLHRIEPRLGGVPHVVIHQHACGLRPFHDADVVLGGDSVLKAQDDSCFGCFRPQVTQRIANMFHFLFGLQGPGAEEGQQKHLRIQGLGQSNGIEYPLRAQRVALQTIVVQLIDAGSVNRKLILLGKAEVAGNHFRIVRGHLAIHELSPERYLDRIESELGRQRQRLRVGAQVQVPVCHTNAQLFFLGEVHSRAQAYGG